MQPPTDGPRAGYTVAEVQYLIENTSSFDTDMGLELIDMDLQVVADVSEALSGGDVKRSSFADLHATATLALSDPLDWGAGLIRPYMTMTGQTSPTSDLVTMTFYLGAYFPNTPEGDHAEDPPTYDVTGYDILSILDDPVGDAYGLDAGASPLAEVEAILLARGVTQYVMDQSGAARTLATPKVWEFSDSTTWLNIVNDLLQAVGYAGIWSDQNGRLRCHEYLSPSDRSPEWVMTAEIGNTLLTQRRKIGHDYYDAPNRWVFYRTNDTETDQPVDGNGRYEYINETVGETSVESRGGRTITRVVGVDAADHASLVTAAQRTIDADMYVPTTIAIDTAPFPLAWHMDKYLVSDPVIGAAVNVLATSWSMNLDGSDVQYEWSVIH